MIGKGCLFSCSGAGERDPGNEVVLVLGSFCTTSGQITQHGPRARLVRGYSYPKSIDIVNLFINSHQACISRNKSSSFVS